MRDHWAPSLLCAFTCAVACAQGSHAVGTHDVAWVNNSGSGSAVLAARIHYPAVATGFDEKPIASANGWPVVVFLHGYSLLGRDYRELGDALATAGFVAVMLDTAQFSLSTMHRDAHAIYREIVIENAAAGTLLDGVFDDQRMSLMGHSMGGAAVAMALDGSPVSGNGIQGYRCGLAVAPVFPGAPAAGVDVPFGVLGGEGDQVTPYATHAVPYYHALQPATGIKFCYVMDAVCDHMNIVGLGSMQPEVFARTTRIATGFLGRFLDSDMRGLEPVLGVDGVEDPHLSLLMREVVTPQIWSDLEMQSGQTTRVSMVAEGGLCGMFAAADLSPWPLPTLIGDLLVDPLTLFPTNETVLTVERLDVLIEVPDLTSLIGASFALQAVGATIGHPCRLGSAIRFEVTAPE